MGRFADPFATPTRQQMPVDRVTPRHRPSSGVPDLLSLFAAPDGYEAYAGVGSRETPPDVLREMSLLAAALERRGFTLRSGHAPGADQAFESGVGDPRCAEIYLPWRGFEGSTSFHYPRDLQMELKAEAIAQKHHPAWDRCSRGARALHSRNVKQVLGESLDRPARFCLAWTSDGQASGGTGQAIRIARTYGVPVLNLYGAPMRHAVLEALGL